MLNQSNGCLRGVGVRHSVSASVRVRLFVRRSRGCRKGQKSHTFVAAAAALALVAREINATTSVGHACWLAGWLAAWRALSKTCFKFNSQRSAVLTKSTCHIIFSFDNEVDSIARRIILRIQRSP